MRTHLIITVAKKEILDTLRDIRSLSTAFIVPIIFSITLFGMLTYASKFEEKTAQFTVGVAGAKFAPQLIDHLHESGITTEVIDRPPQAVALEKGYPAVLAIPGSFQENLSQFKPITIQLFVDHSDNEAHSKAVKMQHDIQVWAIKNASLRLIARNVHPNVVQPVNVESINISNPQKLSLRILSGVPLLFVMIIFSSAMGMVNEMAAGERERKNLESLLTNPLSRSELLLGKFAAASLITTVMASLGIGIILFSVTHAPLAHFGLTLNISLSGYLQIFIILLPMILMATSLQLFVSFYSRSFKDAQSYNNLLTILPVIPGVYLSVQSVALTVENIWYPVMGTQLLLFEVLSGDSIPAHYYALNLVTPCLIAVLFALLSIHRLYKEKVFR